MPARPRCGCRARQRAPARAARPGGGARQHPGCDAAQALRSRDRSPVPRSAGRPAAGGGAAARAGAVHHRHARLRRVLPDRRRGLRPDPWAGGPGRGPRVRRGQPGQPPARHLRGRPDPAPPADGTVPHPAPGPAARHRHRRRVRPTDRGLPVDPGPVRSRAGDLRLDDGHLPGPARGPGRRRGAGSAAGRDRHDREVVPAHPGQGRASRAGRAARTACLRADLEPSRPALRPGGAARRVAPARRAAPLRGGALGRRAARSHPGRSQLARVPDEPVRQGRCRGRRSAQARRARYPDAVRDGLRAGRSGPGGRGRRCQRGWASGRCRLPRTRHRADRAGCRPVRRRSHLPDDPHRAHPRLLPDRVTRATRTGRQVRSRDLRRPDHRHLAVPARAGEVRHGHPVPAGPAEVGRAVLPGPPAGTCAARDLRGGGVPRAGAAAGLGHHRLRAGPGRRGPPGDGLAAGSARGRAVVATPGAGQRLRPDRRRPDLGGAHGVRLVRFLQGARRGVRRAHLPLGLAQDPSPGGVPGRGAHPRPRDVPQAADPGRRPQPRYRGPAAGREHLRRDLPGRAGRAGGAGGADRAGEASSGPGPARRPGVRHPGEPGRREGDLRGRAGPGGRRPPLPVVVGLLAPGPGVPAGGRTAGAGGWLRLGLRAGRQPAGPASGRRHPPRPAAADRRAGPVEPVPAAPPVRA